MGNYSDVIPVPRFRGVQAAGGIQIVLRIMDPCFRRDDTFAE